VTVLSQKEADVNEAQNTKVVQDAYAAFLRGDVAGILATLDEQIVWKPVAGAAPYVPTAGERRGKKAVAEFFRQVAESIQFSMFEPREFVAQGDKVVALGHYIGSATGGGTFESDFVMVFTFRDGRIVGFQELMDSAALNAAFARASVRV
jgi:ketosteroid isomerase-like protein